MTTFAELQAYAKELLDYYGPWVPSGTNGYMLTCPLHGGQSLHMTVSDKILLYCHNCGHDRLKELFERVKTDGFDLSMRCTDHQSQNNKSKKSHLSQNIPAHDQAPLDYRTLSLQAPDGELHPVTKAYTYTDQMGNVLFYQLRADTNTLNKKGKREKILKPYSSVHNDLTNTNTWEFTVLFKPRPLYNLKEIHDNPDKEVIIFEGEKACEAAKSLFPAYICTSYSLGMANWKSTDFTPLKGRKVILWPDNHPKSIEQFLGMAAILEPKPKITFINPLTDRPENWDVADELPPNALPHDAILKNSFIPEVKSNLSLAEEGAIFDKYNKHLRLLWVNGQKCVYDRDNINHDTNERLPYVFYESFSDLPKFFSRKTFVEHQKKPVNEIDVWLESPNKIISYGIIYDPSREEELISSTNGRFVTNKFTGWAHKPQKCDPKLYQCFLDHINHVMDKQAAKFFINFIAQLVQDPKNKPGVMPILIGKQSTGKTIIGVILQAMFGQTNVWMTDGKTFNLKWTGSFSGKIIIFVNEFTRKEQNEDWLNTLLTDKYVSFEAKQKNIWSEESFHRIIATTNWGDFTLSLDDRRFYPINIINDSIDSFNKNPKNKEYFRELDKLVLNDEGLCGLHEYFKTYKLDMDINLPPMSAFRRERMAPISPIDNIILEIATTGSLPEKFNKIVTTNVGEGRSASYPQFVLRKHLLSMAFDHYKFSGTKIAASQSFMRFLEPSSFPKDSVKDQKFYRMGSSAEETDRDRVFEFPPLAELRKRYNSHVDPNMGWPEIEEEPPKKDDPDII